MGDGTGVYGEDICDDRLFLEDISASNNLLDFILIDLFPDQKITIIYRNNKTYITFEPKQNNLDLIRKCREKVCKRRVNLINKKTFQNIKDQQSKKDNINKFI